MTKIFSDFVTYCLFDDISIVNQKALFHSRRPGTWRQHIAAGKLLFAKARVLGYSFFPFDADTTNLLLASVPEGRWSARTWSKISDYLAILAKLNRFDIPPDMKLVLEGKKRQNFVQVMPRSPRPLLSPQEFRELLFRLKALHTTFYQQRALLAIVMAYYSVGRSYDLSSLKGLNIKFEDNCIRIIFGIRKNSKCGLDSHSAVIFPNSTYLCPVGIIVKALFFLKIKKEDYLLEQKLSYW